jgi:hypothetical protein
MLSRSILIASLILVCAIRAEEPATPAVLKPEDQKKAESLIAALGADEFQKREDAQKELANLGEPVLPLLKETAAKADDAEVKSRATLLVDQIESKQRMNLLLAGSNNDPELVLVKANEMKKLKKQKEAIELYKVAASLFREKAQKSDDQKVKQVSELKAQMCERNAKTANLAAGAMVNGNFVQINNGAQIRIRVQNGAEEVEVIGDE